MSTLSIREVQRDCVCRLCDGRIPAGSRAFALEGVHVPPKQVNLFFHVHCLSNAQAAEIERLRAIEKLWFEARGVIAERDKALSNEAELEQLLEDALRDGFDASVMERVRTALAKRGRR